MKRLQLLFILILAQTIYAQENIAFLDAHTLSSKSTKNKIIASHIAPFQLMEGMMLVKALTNNKLGNYIIDTGAPVLVINEKPKNGLKAAARGISQSLETREVHIKKFHWSGIQLQDIAAYSVDISHLERASGLKIAGIIGYDILKDYELFIDYQQQQLKLVPFKKKKHKAKKPVAVIPFTMQAHLPVIKVKIGNKKFHLAIDTGSEVNVLHSGLRSKIDEKLILDSYAEEIQGVDQRIDQVEAANISLTEVKKLPFANMKYVFTDLSHLKNDGNLYIDGLLGYPFLKNGKFSINYKERKIYVWSFND